MKYCEYGEAATLGWWSRLPSDVRMMLAANMDKRPNELPKVDADEMEMNNLAKDALIAKRAKRPVVDDVIRVGDTFVCDAPWVKDFAPNAPFVECMKKYLGKEQTCVSIAGDLIVNDAPESDRARWPRSQCRKVRKEELEPRIGDGYVLLDDTDSFKRWKFGKMIIWYGKNIDRWSEETNAVMSKCFSTWLKLKKTLEAK